MSLEMTNIEPEPHRPNLDVDGGGGNFLSSKRRRKADISISMLISAGITCYCGHGGSWTLTRTRLRTFSACPSKTDGDKRAERSSQFNLRTCQA